MLALSDVVESRATSMSAGWLCHAPVKSGAG